PVPRLAWIGEPTSWQVAHAHKSIVLFEVAVRGRGGHSGDPAAGVNAIAVMAKAIDAVGQIQHERRLTPRAEFKAIFPDAPYDVFNFGTIQGGIALNMIAEECTLRISYRSMPDADPLALHREVVKRLDRLDTCDHVQGEHRASIEVGPAMVVPPLNSERDTPLESVLFDVTGTRDSGGGPFGSDGGWFAQNGITSLICGPGDLEQAHQPNESIGRDAFERGPAIILEVVDRLCCR